MSKEELKDNLINILRVFMQSLQDYQAERGCDGVLSDERGEHFFATNFICSNDGDFMASNFYKLQSENEELKKQVESLSLYMKDTVIIRKCGEWSTNMNSSGEAESSILRAAHKFQIDSEDP